MKMNKIALSIILTISAVPVFASEFKSYQLSDYNCEESSVTEVKACLETTLAEKNANLSEAEYHLKKAINDIQFNNENKNDLKSLIADDKISFKSYAEQDCELKVAVEGLQNKTLNVDRLSLICQINAIEHRVEVLTEMTNDLINTFVDKNSEFVKSPSSVEVNDKNENNDATSPPDVKQLPTEEITPIETNEPSQPDPNSEMDI
jgi:hypothetical protein